MEIDLQVIQTLSDLSIRASIKTFWSASQLQNLEREPQAQARTSPGSPIAIGLYGHLW